jgi:hypothetical protein
MLNERTLEELWDSAVPTRCTFPPERVATLPLAARRYLSHAVAPGSPMASAVRLRMRGEIRLGRWLPFTAEQVIREDGQMIWRATLRAFGLPIRGSDRFVDGHGAMRWSLLGLIPVVAASGPDITRSAIGRVQAESIWLPSGMCSDHVAWMESGPNRASAGLSIHGERAQLDIEIEDTGRLRTISMDRWGNPENRGFHYARFGGIVEDERTFGGNTIPTRLRIGWHFGSDRFESEGEFFRVSVEEATYQ